MIGNSNSTFQFSPKFYLSCRKEDDSETPVYDYFLDKFGSEAFWTSVTNGEKT